MRVALAGGVAVCLLALAASLTADPIAVALGSVWTIAWAMAFVHPERFQTAIVRHTWALTGAVAAANVATTALTGGYTSTLTIVANWLVWPASIAVSLRRTLVVTVAISASNAAALLASGMTPCEIVAGQEPFRTVSNILNPWLVFGVAAAISGVFRGFVLRMPVALQTVRQGTGRVAGPLEQLIAGGEPKLLLRRTGPTALTDAELEVVAALACGLAPKQIAAQSGRSPAAIYEHIANAKHKLGARTIEHLIALGWSPR